MKNDKTPSLYLSVIGPISSGKTSLCAFIYKHLNLLESDDLTIEETLHEAVLYGKDPYKYLFDKTKIRRGLSIDFREREIKSKFCNIKITDTPGHPKYVQSMIRGISTINSSIIVYSIQNEMKLGLEDDKILEAQLIIARTLRTPQFIVVINKMDSVNFSEKLFETAKSNIYQIFKKIGLADGVLGYIPISTISGVNILQKSNKTPWYEGESLFDIIFKNVKPQTIKENEPVIMAISNLSKKNRESRVSGKLISGTIKENDRLIDANLISDNQTKVSLLKVHNKSLIEYSSPGEVSFDCELSSEKIKRGHVFLSKNVLNNILPAKKLKAKIIISNKNISKTKPFIIFSHLTRSLARVENILSIIDRAGTVLKEDPSDVNPGNIILVILKIQNPIIVDTYRNNPILGNIILIKDNIIYGFGRIEEVFHHI